MTFNCIKKFLQALTIATKSSVGNPDLILKAQDLYSHAKQNNQWATCQIVQGFISLLVTTMFMQFLHPIPKLGFGQGFQICSVTLSWDFPQHKSCGKHDHMTIASSHLTPPHQINDKKKWKESSLSNPSSRLLFLNETCWGLSC